MRRAVPLVVVLALIDCKEPTQVVIEARTNVAYRVGLSTSFTVGSPGQTERAEPTTVTDEGWGADGFIGSLVAVPGTTDDAALSVKLVLAIDRDVSDCTAEKRFAGCIVARRRLRYSPSTRLRLPIALYATCIGVPCDESSTCTALGTCVRADVVPGSCEAADGCNVIGEGPDVGPVGVADASDERDGPLDGGGPTDAGATADADAAIDSGTDGGGTPGSVDCRDVTCPTADGGHCCYDTVAHQSGGCAPGNTACSLGGSSIGVYCDEDRDCATGEQCCFVPANESFSCVAPAACAAQGKRLCHVTNVCGAGCTGKVDAYYSHCQ